MSWYQGNHQTNFNNIFNQTSTSMNIPQHYSNFMNCDGGVPVSNYNVQENYCLNQFGSREYYLQQRLQMCYYNSNYSEFMQGSSYDSCSQQECSANSPPMEYECNNGSYTSGFCHNMHYNTGNFTNSVQQKQLVNGDPNHCGNLNHQMLWDHYSFSENSNCIEDTNTSENFG